jgi:hypothetical protein
MLPPRKSWNNFPDVLIHTNESAVKQHARYWEAKTGDAIAADDLVKASINLSQVAALSALVNNQKPTLVSAHAYEQNGVNAIPEAFAYELGQLLAWPIDTGIVQINVVSHTGADGFSRLARQAEFDGKIGENVSYVMVDDFIGMGGTLANLRGHIETNGGKVIAAVALTGKPHSARLNLSQATLNDLRNKHGTELEQWWQQKFGHAFDALTESEARYLIRTHDVATIRHRIAQAEQTGNST